MTVAGKKEVEGISVVDAVGNTPQAAAALLTVDAGSAHENQGVREARQFGFGRRGGFGGRRGFGGGGRGFGGGGRGFGGGGRGFGGGGRGFGGGGRGFGGGGPGFFGGGGRRGGFFG
ncbi:glycine-rich RNA-binding protein-like [Rhagoletis pomonella]|uniref:glycine-rich RNA-binding protein-like n=1 Tax=Rhagoletis pomonella TaxID=28610 RepID=UPI001781A642|nr:glycine-rich RNA-binding protein-like [Rhagoletis pomonella]